jgi:transcriptional regulator with XRE-family HTH domain
MAVSNDPAAPRRMLMAELRAARGEAGLTREAAVMRLDWSLSKLVRIESGDQGVSGTDLEAMLHLYNVTDEQRISELRQLARGTRLHSWWIGYREYISRQFGQYLGLEDSASRIRAFHPMLVPALLHTNDYAFELLRARMSEKEAKALVDLRTERQERLLGRPASPRMEFVFGEEALTGRPIGRLEVMERQLRRLLELAVLPHISIRVVPLSVGAHPGLSGSFILLSLKETGEELLFLEGAGSDLVSRDNPQIIDPFIGYFKALTDLALSEDRTISLIRHSLGKLEQRS